MRLLRGWGLGLNGHLRIKTPVNVWLPFLVWKTYHFLLFLELERNIRELCGKQHYSTRVLSYGGGSAGRGRTPATGAADGSIHFSSIIIVGDNDEGMREGLSVGCP